MKKNKIINLGLLIFITVCFNLQFGCTDKDKVFLDFDNKYKINGEEIKDILIHTNKNLNLLVVDTFLIIQQNEDNVLRIYNTNDYSLLKNYGVLGEGSFEFSDPYLLKQYSYDLKNKSPIIKVFDYERRVLNEMVISV